MPTIQPTARQQSLLDFIRTYWHLNGFPPTIRQCQPVIGTTSPNGVMCHIHALVKKGHLRKETYRAPGAVSDRSHYVPEPVVDVLRRKGGGVSVGTVGGAVAFSRKEWVAWLRAELAKVESHA